MKIQKSKVLIVEDNATNRLLLVNLLEDLYSVEECENGQEAIAKTQLFQPDLILMDVEMPVMNGFDACEVLQADDNSKDIPIIFITAQDNTAYEATALKIGAIDYITKPINANVTLLRIKIQLDLINAKKERDNKILELEKMVRIFELKFKAKPRTKAEPVKLDTLDEYVSFENLAEFEDLEFEMDAIINRMFLHNSIDTELLDKLAKLIQAYSKILRFYPIFNILGLGLDNLSIILEAKEEALSQEHTDTVLTYFESLFFTLKHWRLTIVNKEVENPNMYDASMLSDIEMISLTFENKLDSIQSDIEFF